MIGTPEIARARGLSVTVTLVLLLGVGLRIVQYADLVPLWHDEAAIGRNLDERGFRDLVSKPLAYSQMAPAGWLLLLELASRVPVQIEASLRFPPFVISLAGLFLFWSVARRFLAGAALVGAVLLFAIAPPVLWYSTSIKQYSADIAGSIFLVWLALRHREQPESMRGALTGALGGGVAVLLSFPCVAVAALLGAILLVERWRLRHPWAPLLVLGAGWSAGALVATVAAIRMRDPVTDEFMREFWAAGFLPWGSLPRALLWVPERIWATFAHFLVYDLPKDAFSGTIVALPLVFALAGAVALWRRRDADGLLLVVPTLTGLLLGAAHVLPLRHRVGVYFAWPIVVLAFIGIRLVLDRFPSRRWLRALAFVPSAPLALFVAFLEPPPYRSQATRPVLEAMRDRMRPGDVVYATCGGRHAIAFYGPRLGLPPWTQGSCNRQNPSQLYPEVDRFAGEPRLWMFSTQSLGEAEKLRARLAEHGRLVDEVKDPYGNKGQDATQAVLFDLGGSPSRTPAR